MIDYTGRFAFSCTPDAVPARVIYATVSGDLRGTALSLDPHQEGTVIDVRWTLEMKQRRVRLAARIAYPLLRWGHDVVVEATVRGCRWEIGSCHEEADD